jgi:hypothetical protein
MPSSNRNRGGNTDVANRSTSHERASVIDVRAHCRPRCGSSAVNLGMARSTFVWQPVNRVSCVECGTSEFIHSRIILGKNFEKELEVASSLMRNGCFDSTRLAIPAISDISLPVRAWKCRVSAFPTLVLTR